ncbi:MAG: hypothetical protein WKG07_33865 [Hymenobacter sp.]
MRGSNMSRVYFGRFQRRLNSSGSSSHRAMFITIVMTGLDQDLMQKNLSCRSLADAQKNLFWFTPVIVGVNVLFLTLGVLLYQYAAAKAIAGAIAPAAQAPTDTLDTDPGIPVSGHHAVLRSWPASCSSWASSPSPTPRPTRRSRPSPPRSASIFSASKHYPEAQQTRLRQLTHLGWSVVLIVIILVFRAYQRPEPD